MALSTSQRRKKVSSPPLFALKLTLAQDGVGIHCLRTRILLPVHPGGRGGSFEPSTIHRVSGEFGGLPTKSSGEDWTGCLGGNATGPVQHPGKRDNGKKPLVTYCN